MAKDVRERLRKSLGDDRKRRMAALRGTKTEALIHEAGSEVKENPPRILARTRRKKGKKQAEKQRRAIVLSKARRRGARI